MKPCPSPNCGLTDDHKLDYSDPNVNVLGRNGQNQVTCICGVCGPRLQDCLVTHVSHRRRRRRMVEQTGGAQMRCAGA